MMKKGCSMYLQKEQEDKLVNMLVTQPLNRMEFDYNTVNELVHIIRDYGDMSRK
jgi:hypothetical protein